MAYIVENDLLMSALLEQLEQNTNVMLKSSTSISSVQLPKDGCEHSGVSLKTGERYSCDLLVSFRFDILFLICASTANEGLRQSSVITFKICVFCLSFYFL